MAAISVEFKIKESAAQFSEMLFKDLSKYKKWGKYIVMVDCEYASYLEFGTCPATGYRSYDGNGNQYVLGKFKEWTVKKLKMTGREADQTAYKIYRHAMEHGTMAHPFFRPAFDHMLLYTSIEDDLTPADIAEEFVKEIKHQMSMNGISPSGELYNSVKVYRYD